RACWLLGIDGEGRGNGVDWRENEESRVVYSWRENRFGCYSASYFKRGGDKLFWPVFTFGPLECSSRKFENQSFEKSPF
nr:hypothetical protein [Tanacetum cinerariifolium]